MHLAKTEGLHSCHVSAGSTTVTSLWLQSRVYFLSSLCSTCQYYVTQMFTPSARNSGSRVHTQRFSSYFFGHSSWALLVSLLFLDSEPQGSVLGLFPCLSASIPGMISTSLVVIATLLPPPNWFSCLHTGPPTVTQQPKHPC